MHLRLLFFVFTITFMSQYSSAESTINLAPLLEIAIRLVLLNVKGIGNLTVVEDQTWAIPDDFKNISIGTLNLKNSVLYGFDTLDILEISANNVDTVDDDNKIDLTIGLLINQLGIFSNYDADIGIIDEIPIYGDGLINLTLSEVIVDLNLNINVNDNFSQIYVDDLKLSLQMHDDESYITRFWRNDEVSELVTTILNILEKIVCMFLSYEKECVSCVISPIVQNVVNSNLPNDIDEELVVNCTCLNDLLGEDNQAIFENLLMSYNEGDISNLLSTMRTEHVKKIIEKMEATILEILSNEGFHIDF